MRYLQLIALFLYCFNISCAYAKIVVEGNKRVANETIISYADLPGSKICQDSDLDNAVKKLYATSFFTDVKVIKKGQDVVIVVTENPTIRKVVFEGNSALKDEDLKKIVQLQSRNIYALNKVHNDMSNIKTVYKQLGYYSVEVKPQIINFQDNKVDLIYNIQENVRAKITKIRFIGNENFSSAELKSAILSREYAFYRFFSSQDIYNADKLETDQELLKRHYWSHGYFDFSIKSLSSELTPLKDGVVVTFLLEEGRQYRLEDVQIVTEFKEIAEVEVLKKLMLKKGEIINIQKIEEAESEISEYLKVNGYALADVSHEVVQSKDGKTATVRFVIKEGSRIYINKINIHNNVRTVDKVIRRKLKIAEGDRYNADKIRSSEIRLSNLGYFSEVKFQNMPLEQKDKIDIEIDVQETATGAANFMVGYGDVTGVMGSISLEENNFLGKGQSVELKLQRSSSSGSIALSFTEPYFMEHPIAAGIDLHADKSSDKYAAYVSKALGFGLRMRYYVTDSISHNVRYNFERAKITSVSKDSKDSKNSEGSLIARDLGGETCYRSVLGHTIVWENLDSVLAPAKGMRINLMQDFAGVGGNVKYVKHQIMSETYVPLYKRKVVLSMVAKAGLIRGVSGSKVHLVNNFFLDQDSLRGFEPYGISPRVMKDDKPGRAIGSKNFCAAKVEMSFPLGLPEDFGVNGLIFVDAAAAFGYDLSEAVESERATIKESASTRSSVGLGAAWNSPFGKIHISYAVPIRKKEFDVTQKIMIGFGSFF